MTGVTLQGCHKVSVRLSGCSIAIMARLAVTRYSRVIPGTANEGSGSVTVGTIEVGVDMGCMFAGCSHTIVARGTIVNDTTVIEGRRNKPSGVMANTTVLIRCYMILWFTSRK